ncbi:MAG: glycosyltransferase family 2 protein [Methanogenium sp.]|jgi:hypothetical protein
MNHKYDLSLIIPSRNEEFLPNTLHDLIEHTHGNTEFICILDGWDIDIPELPTDERITYIFHSVPIGQRASVRQAARASRSKYIAKCDAHCSFDDGWDVKMLEVFKQHGDNMVAVPVMRNLHVFNWKCKNGHTRYQSPSGPCKECGERTEKDIVWISKTNPQSVSYCFDEEPHFAYFGEYKKRDEYQKMLRETATTFTMSLQGSFYMLPREKYFEWNIDDEELGSWGNSGIEIACKAWLLGGECRVVHSTNYGHLFRTQGNDFGFPYNNPGKDVMETKQKVRKLVFDNLIPNQIRPLSWLLEKFWPIPGWSEKMRQKVKAWPLPTQNTIKPVSEAPKVGCLFYTDSELPEPLASTVRNQILKVIGDKPLVSVTLKPLDFGRNIVLPLERGKLSMHEQILRGLYELRDMGIEVAYFLEHDVLYGEGYTDFIPPDPNMYFYNSNLWRCRQSDGFCVKYDHKSLSQICAYVSKLIPEYEERVRKIKAEGFNKSGYEPGTRSIRLGGFSNDKSSTWEAKIPNIDVRHTKNLSASKWHPSEFRSLRSCRNWVNSDVDHMEGWSDLRLKIQ